MIRAIGYAGICLGLPERSITRTVRLANATPERLRELIQLNLTDLQAILRYNHWEKLCLFRINQGIIPFVSHPANMLQTSTATIIIAASLLRYLFKLNTPFTFIVYTIAYNYTPYCPMYVFYFLKANPIS
jgi:UV DNA damage repair endonuclease